MKRVLCLPLLLAGCVWADEASDRADIRHTLVALNDAPMRAELFTDDSDGPAVLENLRIRLRRRAPTISISHEPWGEATIQWASNAMHIITGPIRFITPDVALAEASSNYSRLSFVLKKSEGTWRIAAVRVLSTPPL